MNNSNNVSNNPKDTNSKHYTKQLWIFWFNCEPEWKQIIHKDLINCEQGDYDHGLSYECRTLLFKAYHNLIEQSLISIGFCKLGRFFIYPIENQQQQQQTASSSNLFSSSSLFSSKSTFNNQDNHHFSKALQNTISVIANSNRLACSFNFFIHGENTVCCVIDVRLKNPIYKITKSHLTYAQHHQQPIDVILSPFGLSGIVTGNSFKETDNQVQKLINDWRKFFPTIQQSKDKQQKQQSNNASSLISIAPFQLESLEDTFNSINKSPTTTNQSNTLPIMIEVIVAGIKMKYPSNFVFMLQANELSLSKKRSLDYLCKESNKKSVSFSSSKNDTNNECVQDLLFTSNKPKDPQNSNSNSNQTEIKSFKVSPHQPQLPTISYCIKSNLNQELNCVPLNVNHHKDENESNDEIMQSLNKWDIYDVTCKLNCHCSRCKPKKSQKDQLKSNNQSLNKKLDKNNEKENKQTSLFKFNIPFHRRNFLLNNTYDIESSRCFLEMTNESNDKNALTNNNSINNSSQSTKLPNYFLKSTHQPAPVNQIIKNNNLMDTNESSPKFTNNNDQLTNGENKQSENSTNTKFEEMFSPDSGDKSNTNSPKLAVQWTAFQSSTKDTDDRIKSSNEHSDTLVVSTFNKNYFKQYRIGAIKRPLLPSESHLNVNCNQLSSLLYDFESMNNLNVNWDIPPPKNQRLIKGVNDESSKSYNGNFDNFEDISKDPYEFDDDCMRNNRKIATAINKSNDNSVNKKDDKQIDKDNPLLNKILTSEGIAASLHDLDNINIFDCSDNDSNGDCNEEKFSVPAKMLQNRYDHNDSFVKLNGKSTTTNNSNSNSILCDIARMFPTPPSLEPNTAPSPYSCFVNSEPNNYVEDYPLSPMDSSKDVANVCVYNAPLQNKFISSSKYSPLPSINILNLKIPDECNYKLKSEQKSKSNNNNNNNQQHQSTLPSVNKRSSTNNKSNQNKLSGYIQIQSADSSSTNKHDKLNSSSFYSSNASQFDNSKQQVTSSLMFNNSLIELSSNNSQLTSLIKKEPFDNQLNEQYYNNHLNNSLPEINSLIVTLVLSDSMLNIFKDHNFNSCPMCICNMNIKGSDIDVYLPDNLMANDEAQYKCSCGFSAIQNRHNSTYTGLFYEDEFEITNVCYDPLERLERRSLFNIDMIDFKTSVNTKVDNELRAKHDQLDSEIIDLLKSQCAAIFSSSNLLSKSLYFELFKKRNCESLKDKSDTPILLTNPKKKVVSKRIFMQRSNALFRSDSCEITFLALMLGRQGLQGFPNKTILKQYNQIEDVKKRKQDCIHEWIFDNGSIHSNNYEVVQFLKNMQTILQETVQRRLKDLTSTLNMKSK